jgi:hypothetical protein
MKAICEAIRLRKSGGMYGHRSILQTVSQEQTAWKWKQKALHTRARRNTEAHEEDHPKDFSTLLPPLPSLPLG